MTASTITAHASPAVAADRALAGVRPLIRKELADWRHGKRVWVILLATTLFMALSAANSWINAWVIANVPADATGPDKPISMAPLDNVFAAVGSQIFVIAAIFAVSSVLIGERDRGTLAWLASKPIARPAIWTAKWVAGAIVVSIAAVVIPLAITLGVVTAMYGAPAVLPIVALATGMVAMVVLFVAVGLAASTVVNNQAAVTAIGFAVLFLPAVVVALIPIDIEAFLPTSIMGWAVGLASGAPVGFITPIAWAASLVLLAVFAARRMDAMEL
jgi:ABC-2 type transport system permease protein